MTDKQVPFDVLAHVYNYVQANEGATRHTITRDLGLCPDLTGRVVRRLQAGVETDYGVLKIEKAVDEGDLLRVM